MRVEQVAIDWHPRQPIFAKESFLQAVGDEYGWLGGFSESGELRCVLPYTVVTKALFRMIRFRVETMPLTADFGIAEEKEFLIDRSITFVRSARIWSFLHHPMPYSEPIRKARKLHPMEPYHRS